ncbi:hypothetical protein FALCPG4_000336 [Fusarium falciforme]
MWSRGKKDIRTAMVHKYMPDCKMKKPETRQCRDQIPQREAGVKVSAKYPTLVRSNGWIPRMGPEQRTPGSSKTANDDGVMVVFNRSLIEPPFYEQCRVKPTYKTPITSLLNLSCNIGSYL